MQRVLCFTQHKGMIVDKLQRLLRCFTKLVWLQQGGVCMQRILFLETWRWCFFFAGFVPIHYVSEGAVRVAEMIVESKLFTVQQALYFAVSIHVSPAWETPSAPANT